MTGRALARVAGLSQPTAQRALTRLRQAGLVVAEPAPPALVYRANAEHLAMPALLWLLGLEERLRARLAEHVAGWQRPPESVVVYGSVVRGQTTVASDIDVLVVRADAIEPDEVTWQRQLGELSDRVLGWTGKRASVVEMSLREAREGLAAREPFLVEADRDGWLIAGRALHELSGQVM
jgi:predicted nucleotidyltransferase